MSNLTDKELDRLSREAADLYEPDESSLSWSRLEQRLVQQMPERPPDGFRFGRINPYIWGTAVVLVAGLSFILLKNNFYSQHSTLNENNSRSAPSAASGSAKGNDLARPGESQAVRVNPGQVENKIQGGSVPAMDVETSSKGKELTDKTGVDDHSGERDHSVAATEAYPTGTAAVSISAMKHQNSGAVKNSRGEVTTGGRGKQNSYKSGGDKALIPLSASVTAAGVSGSQKTGDMKTQSESMNNSSALNAVSEKTSGAVAANTWSLPGLMIHGPGLSGVKGNDSLLNRFSLSTTVMPTKSLHLNRSLNFGIVFGTDYTAAGGIANNEFGNNFGLTLGYYLTRRLSLNSGFIYSNRFFWAPGNIPAQGYPQYPVNFARLPMIENINGAVNLYEVPLTLRYDFATNGKNRFFANAGLSSYFIIKQTYYYFLHDSGNPFALKKTIDNQENYWFDVADFSLGMETDIGKGFSFQVEPFMKLPVKKMGTENLKLNTYGILFSFKFTPVLGRSKK